MLVRLVLDVIADQLLEMCKLAFRYEDSGKNLTFTSLDVHQFDALCVPCKSFGCQCDRVLTLKFDLNSDGTLHIGRTQFCRALLLNDRDCRELGAQVCAVHISPLGWGCRFRVSCLRFCGVFLCSAGVLRNKVLTMLRILGCHTSNLGSSQFHAREAKVRCRTAWRCCSRSFTASEGTVF